MNHTVRIKSLVLVALVLLALSLMPLTAAASGPGTKVNGGGQAMLTDPDGNTFPIQFAISGRVADDGSATLTGRIRTAAVAAPDVTASTT